jgi:hypothetical protein
MTRTTPGNPNPFWNPFTLGDGQHLCWDVGALCLHAQRSGSDWSLAWTISESPVTDRAEINGTPVPLELESRRWVFPREYSSLSMLPEMPDRSLVVRPREPLGIPPGSTFRSLIHFPVHAGVAVLDGKNRIPLVSIPTERLSNTWFGDTTSGELAYACRTPMLREASDPTILTSHVLCPFRVHNASETMLQLERVLLRMKPLSIYQGQNRLWTNEVSVVFKGESSDVQIEYTSKPPPDAVDPVLLTEAAEKPERGFLRHAFRASALFRKKD